VVLANAWDVASAVLVEQAGAAAVATTSAGVAWSLGAPDGNRLGAERAAELVARIAAAVRVPVSADVESGYADGPDGVARTIRAVVAAGAVGVNLEDGAGGSLYPVEVAAQRVAAARAAGVPVFINARTDVYLRAVGAPDSRLGHVLQRARAYLAAGADGIFVPGVTDPDTVAALVAGIDAPVNILTGPGAPSIPELAALGVARISVGSKLALRAYAAARQAAEELFGTGTYDGLAGGLDYAAVNALLARDR
jgi:2-methylisocitrate lyase-like PEP mutase family enzyme